MCTPLTPVLFRHDIAIVLDQTQYISNKQLAAYNYLQSSHVNSRCDSVN